MFEDLKKFGFVDIHVGAGFERSSEWSKPNPLPFLKRVGAIEHITARKTRNPVFLIFEHEIDFALLIGDHGHLLAFQRHQFPIFFGNGVLIQGTL